MSVAEPLDRSDLNPLRIDLARRSQWNIGYFAAGAVYWTFAAAIGSAESEEIARVAWAVGGGFIFPLALLLSRAWKADPFTKGNPLGTLVSVAHGASIWLLMPLVVVAWIYFPAAMPLALAIALGVSYPTLSWAFGDPIFLWHIVFRVTGVTTLWFAMPNNRYTVLPAFVALLYLSTVLLLPGRRRHWLQTRESIGTN